MGEGLRVIPDLALAQRIILLCQKTKIATNAQEPFEKLSALRVSAEKAEAISKPERAGEKRSFAGGQAVDWH